MRSREEAQEAEDEEQEAEDEEGQQIVSLLRVNSQQ